ncbi:MAG: hypothetical protein OXP66_16245 [Candidatus Tectomicrobia bacterium]|nr:hypothetical protein [Candidatus Tectomicrobia bacterium]
MVKLAKFVAKGGALGLSVAILLSGCSPPAKSIEATPVPPARYQALSCKQLAVEIRRHTRLLEKSARTHDQEHTTDTLTVVGGFFAWPVWLLLLLDGGDRTEELGRLKGEYIALSDMAWEKECPWAIALTERGWPK